MNDDHIYTPSVKTDVLATFRRLGWTPPSEQPEMVKKWDYYKTLPMREHDCDQ